MNLKPRKLLRNGLLQNIVALYGVQACTYALPLLTFPYLARVLGPTGWGTVVFAQAVGSVIAIFVEYGFDISATRETSQHRGENRRLSELISGVLGAKGALSILAVIGAILCRRFTYHVAPSAALFWASTAWGVCQGINMLWFFQGLERMRLASALEIGGKVVATLSIFVLVRNPDDGWKVMAAQCVGCIVSHGITVVLAYREVGLSLPSRKSVWNALRLGWSMFLFRAGQGLSNSLNGLVLGSEASVAALGAYAGAERITRVFQQGMWPINQALYPRLAHRMQRNADDAMNMVRGSIYFLGGLGVILGAALAVGAPLLVHVVLGARFEDSIPTLRVFSLWIPLVALSTVLTFQLILPNRLDRQFNIVVVTQGLVSIAVSVLLAHRYGGAGIAWAAVVAQAYAVGAFVFILQRAKLNPFARNRKSSNPEKLPSRGVVVSLPSSGGNSGDGDLDFKVG